MRNTVWQPILAALTLANLAIAQRSEASPPAPDFRKAWNWQVATEWVKHQTGEELLAAMHNDSPFLKPPTRPRLKYLLKSEHDRLIKSWLAHPELRAQSRQLLAALPIDWADVRAKADESHYAAIDLAATDATTMVSSWIARLDGRHSEHVRAVISANATAQRQRTATCVKELCTESTGIWHMPRPATSPFACRSYIVDKRAHVRAAAAAMLRRSLGDIKIPRTTLAALADHPSKHLRRLALGGRLHAQQFAKALATLSEDSVLHLAKACLDDIPAPDRRTAANQLFRAALAVATQPAPPPSPHGPGAPQGPPGPRPQDMSWEETLDGAANKWAVTLLTAAINCDRDALSWILAMAVNTNDATARKRALIAVYRATKPTVSAPTPPQPTELAPLAENLLVGTDPQDSLLAARILDRTVKGDSDLNARLYSLARSFLDDDNIGPHLALIRRAQPGCCAPPQPYFGPPTSAQAQVVLTASSIGDAGLIKPLLARLEQNALGSHRQFLIRCLNRLAHQVTPEQAPRISALIAKSPSGRDAKQLLTRLLDKYPTTVLPTLVPLAHKRTPWVWQTLLDKRHILPRDQVLALLVTHPPQNRNAALLTLDTKWMKHMSDGNGAEQRLAVTAVDALLQANGVTTQEIQSLPRAMLADALVRNRRKRLPLTTVAALRDHLGQDLAAFIRGAQPSDSPMQDLRALSETDEEATLLAVAELASRIQPNTIAPRLIDKLLLSSNAGVCKEALRIALRREVPPDNWHNALKHCEPHLRTHAESRFGSARWINGAPDEDSIQTQRFDPVFVREALRSKFPVLLRAALLQIRQLDQGAHPYRRHVVQLTHHADAGVRREAYAVLATRDRNLWPSAWLAYEAAFDHDATVRAMAPDAPTAK